MFTNVLVAVKEGAPAQALIALATSAAAPQARLHLVTLLRAGTQEDEPQRLSRAKAILEEEVDRLRTEGFQASAHVGLVVVAAAAELVEIATREDCDLLVIGLAKRTRVGKALMGSDAQRVLLSASCPVLVRHLYGL